MSAEQNPRPRPKPETLSEDQEHLSRELFIHRFLIRYLYFQEFIQPGVLFQTDLVKDKREYDIIFPYEGTDYVVPYGSLDMAFINVFEKDLEDPDQKPINFKQELIVNKHTRAMPAALRNYLGKKVETMETIYWLKPIEGKKRAIWQTTYLDQLTGAPIAETWEGIVEGQENVFPKRSINRIK